MAITYTIAELAREFDITARAIRFYEDQGLLSPMREGQGGRNRVYTPRDRTRLRAATEFIQARLSETISLAELSAAVGLTQYQLISLFKRTTGLTPHAYVTQLRVDRAAGYLAQGLPLAEVAITAGFYDQSALTRHFKRCHGITPLQYAEATRPLSARE